MHQIPSKHKCSPCYTILPHILICSLYHKYLSTSPFSSLNNSILDCNGNSFSCILQYTNLSIDQLLNLTSYNQDYSIYFDHIFQSNYCTKLGTILFLYQYRSNFHYNSYGTVLGINYYTIQDKGQIPNLSKSTKDCTIQFCYNNKNCICYCNP